MQHTLWQGKGDAHNLPIGFVFDLLSYKEFFRERSLEMQQNNASTTPLRR